MNVTGNQRNRVKPRSPAAPLSATSPALGGACGIEDLGEPRQSGPCRSLGKREAGEKAGFGDFPIRRAFAQDPEAADDVNGDVIAPRSLVVEEDAVEDGRRLDSDARLFLKFARERRKAGLADLDAAAGKMPARDIAVPHQEDTVVGVDHDRAHAERHRPGQEEAPVQQAQLQPFSNQLGPGRRTFRQGCLSVQAILLPPGQWLYAAWALSGPA